MTYCIVYEGRYSPYKIYIFKKDIIELARYLNSEVNRSFRVLNVYVSEDYNNNNQKPVFFPIEFYRQKFFETYEERLLEKARIDKILV